ncbi:MULTISPECIES: c-type cytochrome biogenesis protein CcmI [Gammaproteobacteria]|uniref:c-type cytochrome biogenesis protein CcmI n=1 Tax=Gammaproteobacteria TaxID=1236 RepID=UPI001ADA50FF|nr:MULTISPECIES: c-type cytochrome biogenesis protein CcmI [Gammaproteobacteria]MBO9481150.1 c-type cytochrome biogenesis protein CcmI [Salinisphaera sp. G21_0]MBO9494441.1 c-type cytochrome biogenesis protein CcmI [Thalassotalea sp. G20_0]
MMEFWLIAALLIAIAVLVSVWPLIKPVVSAPGEDESEESANVASFRDQMADLDWQLQQGLVSAGEAERLKLELRQKLADELGDGQPASPYSLLKKPGFALLIALIVPVSTVLLYFKLGATTEIAVVNAMNNGNLNGEQVETVLKEWVAKRPENNQALFMLGSHYLRTGKLDEAVKTYRHLASISNGHPQVTAELAQVLFLSSNNVVTPEIRELYLQTLLKDSQNTTALGLKGIDAFTRGNYQDAIAAWQLALTHEVDPAARQSLSAGINQARSMLGDTVVALRVMIDLAPELGELPDDARVVVFARPAGDAKQPPLVAVPLSVGDLPREVLLDDNSAMMMGGQLLSSIESLDITARISLTGNVMSPDYQVQAKGVKTTATEPVRLTFTPAG